MWSALKDARLLPLTLTLCRRPEAEGTGNIICSSVQYILDVLTWVVRSYRPRAYAGRYCKCGLRLCAQTPNYSSTGSLLKMIPLRLSNVPMVW